MMQERMELIKNDFIAETGMPATVVCNCKNGIDFWGLRCGDVVPEMPMPIVYIGEDEPVKDYIARAEKIIRGSDFVLNLDTFGREYILDNCRIDVQRVSRNTNNIITRKILNLEAYITVDLNGAVNDHDVVTTRLSKALLDRCGIAEDTAWAAAKKNTLENLGITNLAEILGINDCGPDLFDIVTMRHTRMNGAAALACPEVFRAYCQDHGYECILLLPSSIHEILIVQPGSITVNYLDLAKMVDEINRTQVEPEIQLEPVVYKYDLSTHTISIVADAR